MKLSVTFIALAAYIANNGLVMGQQKAPALASAPAPAVQATSEDQNTVKTQPPPQGIPKNAGTNHDKQLELLKSVQQSQKNTPLDVGSRNVLSDIVVKELQNVYQEMKMSGKLDELKSSVLGVVQNLKSEMRNYGDFDKGFGEAYNQ